MKKEATGSKLLRGAFILSAAALLSKLIGTLQKIPLQNLGGDAVFGIYNTVYPIYTLLVTVAMLGLPAAVSKYVAEDEAGGGTPQSRQVLRRASLTTTAAGLLLAAGTYAGAPLIARFIGSGHIVAALRTAAFGLAVVPLLAALRGYFQGLQNMLPTAVSQIIEQSARVAVMITLLLLLTRSGAGAGEIASGAMLGSAGGGLAGLAVMLLFWRRHRRGSRKPAPALEATDAITAASTAVATMHAPETSAPITAAASGDTLAETAAASSAAAHSRSGSVRSLLAYGVPVMLGGLAAPLISLVDVFTMPRLLADVGGESQAMADFGIYNRGLPIVQLVTMLATSLTVLFIPALAESKFRGDTREIESRCRLSLRWFWLLGLAASAGLAVLAVPINIALYGDAAGSGTIRWLAFTAAGGTVSLISAALLQGLGHVRAPALHFLAAAALKAALNLLLVPQQGIMGAAIAGVAAQALAAGLNLRLLRKAAGLTLRPAEWLGKPAALIAGLAVSAAAAGWAGGALLGAAGVHGRIQALGESLLGVAAGCLVFAALAVRLRLLDEGELMQLPGFGPKLARKIKKWGLFP
ncbi:polysaccharide biosynthesis protein [Paenibacillus sp. HN-1]|uniref:putative polysaccharide biosynthesis protein n=1 Tax=Paenibacillus TaxID=44249 RepID=UPI001CA8DB0B|nr:MULTISPECIES: polysaccharide biosynthesis protein [Paenibacillus]MBY9082564.1 polysaccharide biosynthesis protein [Paenibacillus sp. CGMCC 1.18879]MBY9086647.1 polysaccharide biosynthesis protein [Paenibacillus sinensis]